MVDLIITEFARLNINIPSGDLSGKGGNLPNWLEEAIRKTKQAEKEVQAFEKQLNDESPDKKEKRKYEDRINDLFADFDKHLPKDYDTYKTPQLEKDVNATKDNIRLFAEDMHKLSELAGGNPKLEQQAEKITSNLLDRLKNDLGLTPEERKQLEGKSLDEIKDYYAQTRSDKLDKLNDTVNGYRQELHELNKSCEGKSPEEKAKIYEAKLEQIELKTGDSKVKADMTIGTKYETLTINDVKSQPMTSQNMSEQELMKRQNEKAKIEPAF